MPDLMHTGDGLPSKPIAQPPHGFGPPAPAQDDDTIELRDILGVLRRNWLLIAILAAVCTAAAAYFAYTQEPQYRAEAVFRLKNEQQALGGPIGGGAVDQVLGKTADPLLSEIQVLRSRTVLSAVVDSLGLRLRSETRGISVLALADIHAEPAARRDTIRLIFAQDGVRARSSGSGEQAAAYGEPIVLRSVRFTVPERPPIDEATFTLLPAAQAADRILERLIARPVDRTDVVQVQFTSTDPRLAEIVVNTTVEAFRHASTQQSVLKSRRRRAFIEDQLLKTDSALAEAQAELSAFRMREEVLSSRDQFAAQQANRMELELRREELDAERRMYRSLLARLDGSQDGAGLGAILSTPGIGQNPMLLGLVQQLRQYRASYDSLVAGGRAPGSPEVQRLGTLIGSTQQQLRDAATSHVSSLEARIASIDGLRARSSAEIRSLPEKEAEEMRLVQRLETARRVADQLREEYQRAQIAEAVEVGQVEVVDWATAPRQPVGTGRPLKVALGLVLGLMIGGAGAFLREHLDTQVSRKDELEPLLGVPVLGVIPPIEERQQGGRTPLRRHLKLRSEAPRGHAVERPLEALVTVNGGRSAGAEAYRSLRTNILFSRASRSLQSIVITSSLAAEGKTTTAANLAVTFAQQGLRVILADVDLRKARLHHTFGMMREPGLVDVLTGEFALEDALRPTPVENLAVLTAGTLPPNPAELIGNERMRVLLEQLQQRADLVILDAAPVLVAGDASILATMAHGTVLVVRAGVTDRDAARAAAQQLRTVGARVVGSVLNDPDGKIPSTESYYYGHAYYGDDHA